MKASKSIKFIILFTLANLFNPILTHALDVTVGNPTGYPYWDTYYINQAISSVSNSGGGTVTLPSGKTYKIDLYAWSNSNNEIGGIKFKSNVTLNLTGVTLQAATNNFKNYSIISFSSIDEYTGLYNSIPIKNCSIVGGTIIGDRKTHTGTNGEWGFGIYIGKNAENIILNNVTVKECWGDGFYIGSANELGCAKNIELNNCTASSNRRNGLSITNVNGLTVNGGVFEKTGSDGYGTNPMFGIDIEADSQNSCLKNITLNNVIVKDNIKGGIQIVPGNVSGTANKNISININNCTSINDGVEGSLFFIARVDQTDITGTILVSNLNINNPQSTGIIFKPWGCIATKVVLSGNITKGTQTKQIVNSVANDFDGDRISDIHTKNTDGTWKIDYSYNGFDNWDATFNSYYGGSDAHPVPADYDGDGKTDLSIKNDAGMWGIDYANNGFGYFDNIFHYYGFSDAHPVPADYDGDGKADLSIKSNGGMWGIDFASNGFGYWDVTFYSYGGALEHPVPADYDGDGKADLSVKSDWGNQSWYIDYAFNGFGSWDWSATLYGGSTAHPARADYDGDGKADLSVKTDDGNWLIDYSTNGFHGWDYSTNSRGNENYRSVPADYDGDGKTDLSVKENDGEWKIDYAKNGYGLHTCVLILKCWDDEYDYGNSFNTSQMVKSTITSIESPVTPESDDNYDHIAIYNINGQIIKQITAPSNLNDFLNSINLQNGLYIVKMLQNSMIFTKKIYIKN